MKEKRYFFFEKKNQKTFAGTHMFGEWPPTSKSFLVLFFKKELLLLPADL
jgi:hypothetical protein